MKAEQRRIYRSLAWVFIVIAAAFVAVVLAERLFAFDFFSGNALPAALFVGVIGLLLLWTARERPDMQEPESED